MATRSDDRTPDARTSPPRSTAPGSRGYARRIDCTEKPRPQRAEEAHGRGRGVPDPETWARAHPMVH